MKDAWQGGVTKWEKEKQRGSKGRRGKDRRGETLKILKHIKKCNIKRQPRTSVIRM